MSSKIRSDEKNPVSIKWPALGSAVEAIGTAEHLAVALADKTKGVKCSWEASTILGGGSGEELMAMLNAQRLTLPRGQLGISYCLQQLEGLEQVRVLLGPKAKLSAQAAVFRYPEEDRGQLWVNTTPNGYRVQIHLDDPDRLEELQPFLGVEFQERVNNE